MTTLDKIYATKNELNSVVESLIAISRKLYDEQSHARPMFYGAAQGLYSLLDSMETNAKAHEGSSDEFWD